MKANILIGIVVLIVGVALLVVGINSSNSVADQISNTFLGRFTQATTWYILGGIGVSLVGAVMVFLGSSGKKLS